MKNVYDEIKDLFDYCRFDNSEFSQIFIPLAEQLEPDEFDELMKIFNRFDKDIIDWCRTHNK